MTSPDPESDSAVAVRELAHSIAGLRRCIHVLLVVLLLFSGTMFVFLLREVTLVRRQQRELNQYVAQFEQNNLPAMLQFRAKLFDFANRHPDFMPIFRKYFTQTNEPFSGTVPLPKPPSGATNAAGPP